MAVTLKYLNAAKDPASRWPVAAVWRENPVRILHGGVQIATGDDATSIIMLGKIPSCAILLPESIITHGAVTGLTSLHVGSIENTSWLCSALNLSSAGTKSGIANLTIAQMSKQIWQILGLSVDPNREIELFATLNASATPAAPVDVNFQFKFVTGGF